MALFGVVGTITWHHLVDTSMKGSMLAKQLVFLQTQQIYSNISHYHVFGRQICLLLFSFQYHVQY